MHEVSAMPGKKLRKKGPSDGISADGISGGPSDGISGWDFSSQEIQKAAEEHNRGVLCEQ